MKHLPIWGGTCSQGDYNVPVEYDAANNYVMAQFDGVGGICKYSVAGKWKMLKEGSWYAGWTVNGSPLPLTLQKKVICIGKKQRVEYDAYESVRISTELFCHPSENVLFSVFEVHNFGREKTAMLDMHFGFEADMVSYHMEKLRTVDQTEKCSPRFEPKGERYLELEVAPDFIISYASNYDLSGFVHEESRLQLHYKLSIQPGETQKFIWLISAAGGMDKASAEIVLADWEKHSTAVDEENVWLRETFRSDDEELNSLYGYCLNASLSSFKNLGNSFRGFFAGIDYQSPPRTYFRDGYWTLLASLPYRPDWVRDQIVTLAYGIGENGDCPSAVIYNQVSDCYEPFWPDHFDSPSFFIIMIYDYLCWTRDFGLLDVRVNGRTIKQHMEQSMNYLCHHSGKKPDNRLDWVDNVYREGIVVYDMALYCRAMFAMESVCRAVGDTEQSKRYEKQYCDTTGTLQQLLREHGDFNYMNRDGYLEKNTTIELALLAVFGLLPEEEHSALISRMSLALETYRNQQQTYGDWGVMTVFPFYRNAHHTVEKSMFPYRYHNGGDWPYWDGIFALAKLMIGDDGWRYPLTRWFQVSLDHGWLTPVEYYGPVYGKGSNLQGWSSMPAAAMLMGGIGFQPRLDQDYVHLKIPPWGKFSMKHVHFRGRIYHISFSEGRWTVESDGAGHDDQFVLPKL